MILTDTSSDESQDYYWKLMRGAERASREGDAVRAAIIHSRAARVVQCVQDAALDLERCERHQADGERCQHQAGVAGGGLVQGAVAVKHDGQDRA